MVDRLHPLSFILYFILSTPVVFVGRTRHVLVRRDRDLRGELSRFDNSQNVKMTIFLIQDGGEVL